METPETLGGPCSLDISPVRPSVFAYVTPSLFSFLFLSLLLDVRYQPQRPDRSPVSIKTGNFLIALSATIGCFAPKRSALVFVFRVTLSKRTKIKGTSILTGFSFFFFFFFLLCEMYIPVRHFLPVGVDYDPDYLYFLIVPPDLKGATAVDFWSRRGGLVRGCFCV